MENVNLRVLLVEDSESDAKAIYRELRRYPFAEFQLEVVGSTRECAESIKTLAPDIVSWTTVCRGRTGCHS